MARLFGDENFPFPVVEELRRLGHDVLTVQDIGKAEQEWPDEEVFAYACSDGRAVLTINRKHFRPLHRKQPQHTGIILCTYDPDFTAQAGRIHAAIQSLPSLDGQLLRVNRPPG